MRTAIVKKIIILLLLLAGTSETFAQYNLTGYWEDNFGMHYYVRHIDNTVYWFGEHKDGIWSGAFKGVVRGNTSAAIFGNRPITIAGQVYDLPKGRASTQAQLGLRVVSGTEMRKTSGPFSATVFRKKTKPRNLPGIRSAGFSSNGLNGLWKSNTGATYYVRQVGSTVVWFGERPENSRIAFSNVAFGTRNGNTITMDWADVPKGRSNGNGTISIQVNGNRMTKTIGSGFGAARWQKVNKEEFDVSAISALVNAQVSQISVHLNNYDPQKGSDRWYKRRDAYINLPTAWGGRYPITIPEIIHEGPLRNYYYYVQDLNSSPNGVTAEIQPKSDFRLFNRENANVQKQPVIKIAVRLETSGTEVKGRCGGLSDDNPAPDVHISKQNDANFPIIYIYIPLEVHRGRISYGEVKTYFDAKIQAGGICKIADKLCNKIIDYRAIIISEIDKGLKDQFNNPNVRTSFENSINGAVPRPANGRLTNVVLEGDKIVFEHN